MVPMIIQLRLKTINFRSIYNGRWQTVPITLPLLTPPVVTISRFLSHILVSTQDHGFLVIVL